MRYFLQFSFPAIQATSQSVSYILLIDLLLTLYMDKEKICINYLSINCFRKPSGDFKQNFP